MPCLAHVLSVVGGLAEVGGLGLVVAEIVKVQQREFPEHRGSVRRTLGWLRGLGTRALTMLRRVLKHPLEQQDVTVHAAAGTARASGGGATVVVGEPGPPPTLRQRMERLETDLRGLAEQAVKNRDEMHLLAHQAERRTDEVARELREMIERREDERRDGSADALLLPKTGTALVIAGVGLSVWSNLATC